jgi:hypothetical protein
MKMHDRTTRGYAVPHLEGAPTQMPSLILYDDKMILLKGGDGTSHTREPLLPAWCL